MACEGCLHRNLGCFAITDFTDEQNVWIVQPYRLGDSRFPGTIITSRLIEKYKKPFVVPGDNSPGVNQVSEHGNAKWGFAVGAFGSFRPGNLMSSG